jgi:hypothetical protein
MPMVYVDTADIDLEDFDADDLADELRVRGYIVSKNEEPSMEDVIWRYKTGYIKDAMIELEYLYPELYGISKLVGEK